MNNIENDMNTGLSKSQKKNLKKQKKKKEKKKVEEILDSIINESRQYVEEQFKDINYEIDKIKSTSTQETFDHHVNCLSNLLIKVENIKILQKKAIKSDSFKFNSYQIIHQLRTYLQSDEPSNESIDVFKNDLIIAFSLETCKSIKNMIHDIKENVYKSKKHFEKSQQDKKYTNDRNMYNKRLMEILSNDDRKEDKHNHHDLTSAHFEVIDIPVELQNLISYFNFVLRKFELIFLVVVCSSATKVVKEKQIKVYGLLDNLNEVKSFVKNGCFNDKHKIVVPSPVVADAPYRSKFYNHQNTEKKFKCFLIEKNNELFFYGLDDSIQAAIEFYNENIKNSTLKFKKTQVIIVSDSFGLLLKKFYIQELNHIEKKYSVKITMTNSFISPVQTSTNNDFQKYNTASKTSHIIDDCNAVNSNKSIETASDNFKMVDSSSSVNRIQKILVQGLHEHDLLQAKEEISLLITSLDFVQFHYYNDMKLSHIGKRNKLVTEEINNLSNTLLKMANEHLDLHFFSDNRNMYLIGSKESIEKIHPDIQNIKDTLPRETKLIHLENQLVYFFLQSKLDEIGQLSNTYIFLKKKDNELSSNNSLVVWGKNTNINTAEEHINSFISNHQQIQSLPVPHKDMFIRLRKQIESLDIENTSKCSIKLLPKECLCVIDGETNEVNELIVKIKKIMDEYCKKNMTLPSLKLIGSILGHKGSKLNQIISESKVDHIYIDKYKKSISIYGNEASCSIAESLIQNIITKSFSDNRTTTTNVAGQYNHINSKRPAMEKNISVIKKSGSTEDIEKRLPASTSFPSLYESLTHL